MSKEVYERIAAGLKDAIRYLEGDEKVKAEYKAHKIKAPERVSSSLGCSTK